MIIKEEEIRGTAVLEMARKMCIAARTAPKTKGKDFIVTMILTGDDKDALTDKTCEVGRRNYGEAAEYWFVPDAEALRRSQAVVMIGIKKSYRGVPACGYCGFKGCAACIRAGGNCAFAYIDLGIALSSAAIAAADNRIDNRMMWSVGVAAEEMHYTDEKVFWIALLLSASGKNIYFDRKKEPSDLVNIKKLE